MKKGDDSLKDGKGKGNWKNNDEKNNNESPNKKSEKGSNEWNKKRNALSDKGQKKKFNKKQVQCV